MLSVTINSKEISVPENSGQTLLSIFRENGIFISALCGGNHTCKSCRLKLISGVVSENGREISQKGSVILACESFPMTDLILESMESLQYQIAGAENAKPGFFPAAIGIAIDLGTTTIVCRFYDLETKEFLGTSSGTNLQCSAGADVISRIEYEKNHKGLLTKIIREQLKEMILCFLEEKGFSQVPIRRYVIAGNTVMEHLLDGLDPSPIGASPYEPFSLFGIETTARQLNLPGNSAKVFLTPCISGFVGGDITAGILASCMEALSGNTLLLDAGTNGEIVLGQNGALLCCSAAAGPAFEGAHISCGMGAVPGAVSKVTAERIEVIGGIPPKGVCGSGLLDAAALALETGDMDETGRLSGEIFPIAPEVFLTQKDFRELQLAKAAIRAGINTLLQCGGISPEKIDKVFLAGGFGSFLNPESACAIGLLPKEWRGKITPIGNSAGEGAAMLLFSEELREKSIETAKACRYLELSENPVFSEEYPEQMMFPAPENT